jgi:excisionase family DNA binding protein
MAIPTIDLWTVSEAANALGVSVSSLNKWRTTGEGPPFVRLGQRVRYRPADIECWLATQTRISTSSTHAATGKTKAA